MARANLSLDEVLRNAFLSAQESRRIRFLLVKIVGETLSLHSEVEKIGSAQEDFDTQLADALQETEAIFALFCTTDDVSTTLDWILLSWVPDGCRVRDKMLYSSSREDLKRNLGAGYFPTDYAGNYKSDITWENYLKSLYKGFDPEILTETERLLIEEKTLTQTESHQVRSTAMGVLPFELSADLEAKLVEFRDGTGCNWVSMTITTENVAMETIVLVDHRQLTDFNSLDQYVSKDEARFMVIKVPTMMSEVSSIFAFSCPENVPIRMKMTMSSCKASVIAAAQAIGLRFERTIEIRSPDEIDDAIYAEINAIISSSCSYDSQCAGPSSAGANITHSKPQRPGKGTTKSRVSKFKADLEI